mgnify:CR=1 FL=1
MDWFQIIIAFLIGWFVGRFWKVFVKIKELFNQEMITKEAQQKQ